MTSVALDTTAAVEFLRCSLTQEPILPGSRREKVRDYLAYLGRSNVRVLLPTPALGEALAYFQNPGQHDEATLLLRQAMELPPLDAAAAGLAADMWKEKDGKTFRDTVMENDHTWKQCVKVDYQIVAVARHKKASVLLSADAKHMRPICERFGLQFLCLDDATVPEDPPVRPAVPGRPTLFDIVVGEEEVTETTAVAELPPAPIEPPNAKETGAPLVESATRTETADRSAPASAVAPPEPVAVATGESKQDEVAQPEPTPTAKKKQKAKKPKADS